MRNEKPRGLPFVGEDLATQELWDAIEDLPRGEPSADLRRSFYRELDNATRPRALERFRAWLGISGSHGWLTAAACVSMGVMFGFTLGNPDSAEPTRLAALEQNVSLLNRELILDRLEDATASKRLRGVIDASYAVQDDAEIARALLVRATEDDVYSIRSAAIEALGPSMSTTAVGGELMKLLEDAESPLVQLALVDLVLRNGSGEQLRQLLRFAEGDKLHPDLIRHVKTSLGSESI